MTTEIGFIRKLFDDYRFVALFPVIAVIIDYSLTFYLAGDTSLFSSWEASPFVRFAVIHNVMTAYLATIILFYYGTSYAVLRILHGTEYYPYGYMLIVIISIIHVIGGMSWYFRNTLYSNGVLIMSLLSIVIAFALFGFSLIHEQSAV
jgi:hypothetical protein